MKHLFLRPLAWIRDELEFETTFVTVAGSVLLVLYLEHGRPHAFAAYLGGWAQAQDPEVARFWSFCYWHLASFFFLMLVPLCLCKWPLGRSIRGFGLRWPVTSRAFGIAFLLYLALLPLLVLVSSTPQFQARYPLLATAGDEPRVFVLYEVLFLIKWVAWEFFFRGFLLFGLHRKLGGAAILVSTIAFCLVHVGKPEAEALASIVAGFVLCRLALNCGSVFPGVLLHFMAALTLDFLASSWWR